VSSPTRCSPRLPTGQAGELQVALDQLVTAELVYRRGTAPDVTYSFKHALVQDAAYGTLLKSKRQQLHARIAQVMEDQFPEIVETQPELLAQHYTAAGLTEQAIVYWEKAGERAIQRSANAEAIERISNALKLLATVAETPERIRRELALQTRLGPAVHAVKGFASPDAETVYNRARELCAQVADCPQLFVLDATWSLYLPHAQSEARCGVRDRRAHARPGPAGTEPRVLFGGLQGAWAHRILFWRVRRGASTA
jgi:predicted ATPase